MDEPLYEVVFEKTESSNIQSEDSPACPTEPVPQVTVISQAPNPAVVQTEAIPQVTVLQPMPVQVVQSPVITKVNTLVSKPDLKDIPGQFKCPYCQLDVVTVTRVLADTNASCSLFGSHCSFTIWPCCLVPFHSCHDVEHSCPSCRNAIYIYKRS